MFCIIDKAIFMFEGIDTYIANLIYSIRTVNSKINVTHTSGIIL